MRTLIFILSATAILFLTTCEDEPTSANFSNGLRSIKLYNLNSNLVSKIEDVTKSVYNCVYIDSSSFAYSSFYHALGELVTRDFRTPNYGASYFEGGPIFDFRIYPEIGTIFLTASGGIYLVKDFGKLVENVATGASPVINSNMNIMTYGYFSNSNEGMIIAQNLQTSVVDTLLSLFGKVLLPIFITTDGTRLVYTETDLNTAAVSIKKMNIFNPTDIELLTNSIPVTKIGKNRSIDDRIAFLSKGTVYLLNLNTADLQPIANNAQFADISNDGSKVVFTTEHELYLVNSDGTNQQILINKSLANKYLFLPSFSSNDQQIVFVESNYAYGYYYKE